MAPAVKVLYTDVDGTLVGPLGNLFWTSERRLTLDAAAAIVAAHEAGLRLVPLSGRSRVLMAELARLIGADDWIGELGGVRSYDRGHEVVTDPGAFPGPGPLIDALAAALEGLLHDFAGSIEEHSPWNEGRETSLMLRGDLVLDDASDWLRANGYGWAHLVDNGVLPRHSPTLPGVETVRVYHLAPEGLSKRAAVAADRQRRGLAVEECALIGDALSDLECHPEVGRCYVVANALAKDPELASVVGGVANARITDRGHGQGFADAVADLLGGSSG